jgi:MFS-type transporter involved in bile tolerance (Atg22 family)
LKDIHQYRELFKYLVAFLIYIDGIGTIIGVAAIYGAELGFGSIELVLALLLVQFVGIPYSLIFGRLPSQKENRRPFYLAFVLYNIIALPLGGLLGLRFLPGNITGMPPESIKSNGAILGEGIYSASHSNFVYSGDWYTVAMSTDLPETIDRYSPTVQYGIHSTFSAYSLGEQALILENTGNRNPLRQGAMMNVAAIEIQQPARQSNLGLILAFVVGVQLIGLILALVLGPRLFSSLAQTIDSKRGILLALVIYTVIAVWGFFLNSVIEFWFLAWMVAVVQGGSQALSRSLFANMSPASKSGEFFGLFGIMEKFSAIVGPLVFAFAATRFGSSRPAVLSIIAFFILGGYLLTRVNVDEGRRIAKMEDVAIFDASPEV